MKKTTIGQIILAIIAGSLVGYCLMMYFIYEMDTGEFTFLKTVCICWFACFVSEVVTDTSAREVGVDCIISCITVLFCVGPESISREEENIVHTVFVPMFISVLIASIFSGSMVRKLKDSLNTSLKVKMTENGKKFLAILAGYVVGGIAITYFAENIQTYTFQKAICICWFACFVSEMVTDTSAREVGFDSIICMILVLFCVGRTISGEDIERVKSILALPVFITVPIASIFSGSIVKEIQKFLNKPCYKADDSEQEEHGEADDSENEEQGEADDSENEE